MTNPNALPTTTSAPLPTNNNIKMSSNDKDVVISNINSSKTVYINQINSDISSISNLLLTVTQTETDIESEYMAYLQSLQTDLT